MKTLKYIAAAFISFATLVGCQQQDYTVGRITTDSASYQVATEGGEVVVTILAEQDWTATVTGSAAEFVTVEPKEGKASAEVQKVTVKVTSNIGNKDDRNVVIAFQGSTAQAGVKIVQAGDPALQDTLNGEGTAEKPYTVADAIKLTRKLEAGAMTDDAFYIKGIICQDPSISLDYGNADFYISDDGSYVEAESFIVFRAYDLGNVKFTADNVIKKGDIVVVCAKLQNYKGTTLEAVKGYLVSVNGNTSR